MSIATAMRADPVALLKQIGDDILVRHQLPREEIEQLLVLPMPSTRDGRRMLLQRQATAVSLAYHFAHSQGDTATRDAYRTVFADRLSRIRAENNTSGGPG